ncbi:ATP-binding protein, partial [Streptomyces fimicarius]
ITAQSGSGSRVSTRRRAAARASIASVVSGTLRGRAAVDADGDAEPASPPHEGQSPPSTPHEHAGGRP